MAKSTETLIRESNLKALEMAEQGRDLLLKSLELTGTAPGVSRDKDLQRALENVANNAKLVLGTARKNYGADEA